MSKNNGVQAMKLWYDVRYSLIVFKHWLSPAYLYRFLTDKKMTHKLQDFNRQIKSTINFHLSQVSSNNDKYESMRMF